MLLIFAYNLLSTVLLPCYIVILLFRLVKGKENLQAIKSRFGFYKNQKPPAGKNLIWLHAASVGESMIAITLVKELRKRHSTIDFLVTTGTLSSAAIIKKSLFSLAKHEFTPVDNWLIIKRFHSYWQPNIGIFIESELWPALSIVSSRNCKLLLLNARLSDKSFYNWQKLPYLFKKIIKSFSLIAAQSNIDFKKYQKLNCNNLINIGNLKFVNQELKINKEELRLLRNIFATKTVFVASSTHIEDEEIILKIIKRLKALELNIYPVIILRHPERRQELASNCQKLHLTYSFRSENKIPDLNKNLHIVDSFGELGIFYSLSEVVFIGGSFKRGGHNLLEPAYFNNVIIIGPNMSNFQNIADEMIKKKAAIQIIDAANLEEKIIFFIDKNHAYIAKEYKKNAIKYVDNREQILTTYLEQIEKNL